MLHPGQIFITVLHPQAVKVDLFQFGLETTFARNQYLELSTPDSILVCERIIEAVTDASEHATSPRGVEMRWGVGEGSVFVRMPWHNRHQTRNRRREDPDHRRGMRSGNP